MNMQLTHSVLQMTGTPPSVFTPSKMLSGTAARSRGLWRNIPVTHAGLTVTSSTAGTSAKSIQHSLPPLHVEAVAPLKVEMINTNKPGAALSNIPFEIVANNIGEITLSSERQQTPWHFLVKVDFTSKQMSLSFTLNYSGLSVQQALEGARFNQALAYGGKFRISGSHPITGADLPIASGALPPRAYEEPGPFIALLEHLAFIESRAGVSFTIPDHAISAEDANSIAATTHILRTGHASYKAEPWVSVSTVAQAKDALETFESGEPVPAALHFDEQVVVIFGTNVSLGSVTFFCDRTHITKEDLETLRKDLENSTPESTINIRLTPYEDCPVEARYINWLPEEEAAEIKQLPMYHRSDSELEEKGWTLPPIDVDKAIALLESWYDEDSEEQRRAWEQLKVALDEDRLSDRKLFT